MVVLKDTKAKMVVALVVAVVKGLSNLSPHSSPWLSDKYETTQHMAPYWLV